MFSPKYGVVNTKFPVIRKNHALSVLVKFHLCHFETDHPEKNITCVILKQTIRYHPKKTSPERMFDVSRYGVINTTTPYLKNDSSRKRPADLF